MASKITISDIALEAGASPATVSRVLNGSDYPVSGELRHRILSAADALNYTARTQRGRHKQPFREIGVIVPTVTNPYFMNIVMGVEFEARRSDYGVLIYNSCRDARSEELYIDSLLSKNSEGLILFPTSQLSPDAVSRIRQMPHVVCIDQREENFSGSRVGFNYMAAGIMAVEHLVSLGHKDIAFLTTPLTRSSRVEVFEGYKLGISRSGIPLDPALVLEASFEQEQRETVYEFAAGKEMAARFMTMERRPSAIIAVNDLTAYGIMHELQSHGIQIPFDVSVIGMDNLDTSEMIYPPLTTIHQPANETGRIACKLLLDSISSGGEDAPFSVTLEPELMVRKSTGVYRKSDV